MGLKDSVNNIIQDKLTNLPIGCEGRVISYDQTTNKAVIDIFDAKTGSRSRHTEVDCIAQTATILSTWGRTYSPGDYVYVGWLGGMKTNPVIIGHLRCASGTTSSTSQETTSDKDTTTSDGSDGSKDSSGKTDDTLGKGKDDVTGGNT